MELIATRKRKEEEQKRKDDLVRKLAQGNMYIL